MTSGDYKVMESLLFHEIEVKMCQTVQNDLYDFFMANRVNVAKKINTRKLNSGQLLIEPFILGRRYNAINSAYWKVYNGLGLSGGNYQYDVISTTDMPLDVRWFNESERVYIDGLNVGVSTKTAWTIVSSTATTAIIDGTANTSVIRLVLSPSNAGSFLAAARLVPPVASGSAAVGVLRRGTANKSDYESWCLEAPGIINWNDSPFWVETTRSAFCTSEQYEMWRKLLLEQNPLYREYGDLPQVELNKQLGADFQKRFVNNVFFGKALNANQTVAAFNSLPEIETTASAYLDTGGAECIGKRANVIGIYEQLAECDRLCDAENTRLNLISLFNELYNIQRVRAGMGKPSDQIDIFTDMVTAEAIGQAMMSYYKAKSQDQFRITLPADADFKKAQFGFKYRQYVLTYPAGLVINIVTHYFFDDQLTAATAGGVTGTGRVIWVLDLANIYVGVVASDQKVWDTNQLAALAQIDGTFACTMKLPTKKQRLTSLTYTVVVECPKANLIVENFTSQVPSVVADDAVVYPCT